MSDVILIVEDDAALRRGLELHLQAEGFCPIAVSNGEAALETVTEHDLDLVLLDVMLPGITGLEVCTRLREGDPDLPIILVTARGAEHEVIEGLAVGADDYVVKPFRIGELIARVRARLRRAQRTEHYAFGEVEVDLSRHHVKRDGVTVELSPTEFDLLTLFVRSAGQVLTRDTILEKVWGTGYRGTDRTVDNFVTRLRQKLDTQGSPEYFCTVRGVGYRFEGDSS